MRHVRWHVHATGTWKPPATPESDCYTEDEEGENRVSGYCFTLRLYTLSEGGIHAHRWLPQPRPRKPLALRWVLCAHPSIIGSLANNLRLNFSSRLFWDVWTSCAPTGGVVPSLLRLRCRCHRPHLSLYPSKPPFSPFRFSRRRCRWWLCRVKSTQRSNRTLFSTYSADRFHHLRWLGSPPVASRGGLGLTTC